MSILTSDQGGYVYQNETGSVLDFLFAQDDGATPRDLTGYHGWVTFWYSGSGVHLVRAGTIVPLEGLLRYLPRGDEFPNLGNVTFQATISAAHVGVGVNRGYFKVSSGAIRRRVVPRP